MKNKTVKLTSVLLSMAMVLGIASLTGCAQKDEDIPAIKIEDTSKTLPVASGCTVPDKDEIVYIFTAADGKVENTIVSNWLKNRERVQFLTDVSALKDIENVKGLETFTEQGGELKWQADGRDIYYEGTTEKAPPIALSITYTLDGKDISPEELAGKNGHVTIRFDYSNQEMRTADIGGTTEEIYVPFLVVTGMLLDADIFQNVTVQNGYVESTGEELAVVGLALPGMKEALGLSQANIPNYLEISAEVQGFEMSSAAAIAVPAVLDDESWEELDPEELSEKLGELAAGVNALADGSCELYDGLSTLYEKTDALVSGVEQLLDGAERLSGGANALLDGVSRLSDGAASLQQGLAALDSNSDALAEGAHQVFDTLLSAATAQVRGAGLSIPALTVDNYSKVLNGILGDLDEDTVYHEAMSQVTAGVNAQKDQIVAGVTAVVEQQVRAQVEAEVSAAVRGTVRAAVEANEPKFRAAVIGSATGLTPSEYDSAVEAGLITAEQQTAIQAAVSGAMEAEVEKQMGSGEVQGKIAAAVAQITAEKLASDEVQQIINTAVKGKKDELIHEAMGSSKVQSQLQKAAAGASAIRELKTSLDSYHTFYTGLLAYTGGVSEAAAGAETLRDGAASLYEGSEALAQGTGELYAGVQTMADAVPEMQNGIRALRDGSAKLKDGLAQMRTELLHSMSDLSSEELTELADRMLACVEAGREYTSFTGKSPEAEGSVKFVYKTNGISVQ